MKGITCRLQWGIFLLACSGLFAAYVSALSVPGIGLAGDDGAYVVTGKALAEGRGYRIISQPNEPAQTKYPVLFPALIACIWKLCPEFPANALALKLIAFCFCATWLFLIHELVSEVLSEKGVACWISLFVAASPLTVFLSTAVLSDIPFAALTTASLIWLLRTEATGNRRHAMVAALFASLAFHTRTAGIALLLAGMIALVLKGRRAAAIGFFVVAASLCAPWFVWLALNKGAGVINAYSSWVPYYRSWNVVFAFSLPEKLSVIGDNLTYLALNPISILGLQLTGPAALVSSLASLLIVIGLFSGIRHQLNVIHVFVLVYCLILILWASPPFRFLTVVAPFAFVFGLRGLRAVAGKHRGAITALAVGCLLCGFGTGLIHQAKAAGDSGVMNAWGLNIAPQRWDDFNLAMNEIRRETRPGDLLAGKIDTALYLFTGRQAIPCFPVDPMDIYRPVQKADNVSSFAALLTASNIDYLVESPPTIQRYANLVSSLRSNYPEMIGAERAVAAGYRLTRVKIPVGMKKSVWFSSYQ